jgi:hypothetical protein
MVHLPDGHTYLEEEYVPQRVIAFDQGAEVAHRIKARGLTRILYLVYDTQMETPQGDTGETLIDSFRRGLRSEGMSLSTRKADKDRKNGWGRLRGWLKEAPDAQPWLRVSLDCPYTARTIPALVSDKTDPEDVDSDGDDHAADALRYWAMSRPHPSTAAVMRAPLQPFSWGAIKQQGQHVAGLLSRRAS